MAANPSPKPPHPYFGRRKLGRYELLTPLASGGMGTVFAARSTGMGGFERLVALKVLHPHMAQEKQFVTMFLDEARLAARIRHPNVVSVVDVSERGDHGYFLVMEYVEGINLGALLSETKDKKERLSPPVAFRIIMDAIAGLSAAHKLKDKRGNPLNMVHRDVSPQNVLVGVDGVARLTDFGIAKAEQRLTQTQHGSFKGKAAYAAPEQLAEDPDVDQRSDLFSMGIVLWESLCGKRLFRGDDRNSIAQKVRTGDIPRPSDVHPELAPYDDVLMKALERERDNRFQSADDFLEDLERVTGTEVATLRAVSTAVRKFAGAKLEQEARRINDAAESVGVEAPLGGTVAERSVVRGTTDSDRPTQVGKTSMRPAAKRAPPYGLLGIVFVLAVSVGVLGIRALTEEPVPVRERVSVEPTMSEPDPEPDPQLDPDPDPGPEVSIAPDAGPPLAVTTMDTTASMRGDGVRPAGAGMGMATGMGMQPESSFTVRPNPYRQ